MPKIPSQRGGRSGSGGSNHSQSRMSSVRRGGSPSLGGGGKKGGCTVWAVAFLAGLPVAGYLLSQVIG